MTGQVYRIFKRGFKVSTTFVHCHSRNTYPILTITFQLPFMLGGRGQKQHPAGYGRPGAPQFPAAQYGKYNFTPTHTHLKWPS